MTPAEMRVLLEERQTQSIDVPITALYSKTDGVVAWRACIDELNPQVTHKEVNASHVGMGANVEVFRLVAEALYQRL